MTLDDLGWNEAFAEGFAPFAERGLIPGRLVRETKINFAALLEGGEDEEDNSILCVNMIQADEEEKMVEEGDESIICLDDTCDAFNSVEDSLGITPSAV